MVELDLVVSTNGCRRNRGKANDFVLDGKTRLLERPLRRLALIRAHRCDTLGNLTYQLSARNFNP